MFKKAVRISVDISPADRSEFESSSVHTISIVLESGKNVSLHLIAKVFFFN